MSGDGDSICGGVNELSGERRDEAIELLNTTLAKLDIGDGPRYQALEVISVTGQVVAGMLYVYQVRLMKGNATKQYKVEIWSQPWLESGGTNIKIISNEDDNVYEYTF